MLYYLIRRYPSYLCRLQNDALGGPPDNIFYSLNVSFQNGQRQLSDNKELIPEFFYDTEFLMNREEADLGSDHLGEVVNHVELPPWASSAKQFCLKMSQILEEENIAPWIDLVFGMNQRGHRA